MDDDIDYTNVVLFTLAVAMIYRRRKRNARGQIVRRWWTHPINQARQDEGAWELLMERFRREFPDKHHSCLRMSKENFDIIHQHVKPYIEKADTQLRKAIASDQRLCVTLFYLASGDSFKTLSLFFRMGESTIRGIVYETSQAIWDSMSADHLKTPTTQREWINISKSFYQHWNFPNCVGAIDGKHCNIQAPPNSGSEFFNYKKTFSVVLLAVCDAMYKFTYIDVGTPGRWSDGGTFDHCTLNHALAAGDLNLPADATLPESERTLPYTIVADAAFPLKTYMMRPFPGEDGMEKRIFNYRLSRARRTIENAFGIMVARWRCLRGTLHMSTDHARSVILACCVLHNFLREKSCEDYCPPGLADAIDVNGRVVNGAWRAEQQVNRDIDGTNHRNPPVNATQTREAYMAYFNNEGALPWQVAHITRT